SISDTVYVSGGIHNDTTWRWNVILTGDVTIDSGVTLFVKRGTHIIATGFSDDQHAGLNPSLVEINVKGTLQFDWTPGTPPLITADVDSSGAWGGLVFTKGGRLTAGIGATLENPLVGVTIDSTADAPAIRGLTIRKPSAAGFWCESDAVRLVQDTVVDAPQGYGIYLSQSDPSVDSCFVENCEYGIYAWQSSSTIRGCQVKGPGASGIHVDIFYEGESTPDTVQLIDDTVPGTFSTAHLAGGHCQVEHCWFVSGPDAGDTSRSLYGVRLGQDLWLKMRHSVIRDYGRTGYSSYKSNSDLGVFKGEYGNNRISTGAQCDECVVRCVVHTAKTSSDTLKAEMNYWDSVPPPSWWFGGRVDYTPWLTSPPLGKVSSQLAAEPTVVPANFVVGQNYPNPFNPSTVIEFVLPKASRIRVTVYNVLGQVVKALADRVYPMGRHQLAWDGTDNVGRPAASGIYFYRVVTDESAESKKMVLLR
ncbi:MAG: T9SS type A sorting domain-containing protein, partial [candidate division Zixibacteria bacterium]|nr:T9SS type A sorting domain-containing protein [candidate division Zixibacteria bacterium]